MKNFLKITLAISIILSLFSCDFSLFPQDEFVEPKPIINKDISQITFKNLRRTKTVDISGVGGYESATEAAAILAPASVFSEESSEKYPELSYSVYRVKSGDMVGILAENFGITQDTIISVNNIRQTRTIQPGDYFRIPNIPGIIYTVREDGETIASIAKELKLAPIPRPAKGLMFPPPNV
ncbi:MAG: LysM peptidoglycan-binding domain-containing protein [Spirochaetaceae bacterium]|nr:LysM peptidoglycan-binding domain-containing protein [Spirochaetaceae bacterium]